MSLSGNTCISCAKAKIKCDKNLPRCGRCVRLGVDCHAQARGRGRPKAVSSKPQPKPKPVKELPRAVIQKKKPPKTDLVFVESIKNALFNVAEKGLKGDALAKCVAVSNWLFHVACCAKSELMYDDISNIWEMLNVGDPLIQYENRHLQSLNRDSIHTPSYVSSLNCDGSAFLIQHCIQGSCLFSANEDMTEQFISTKEANALYVNSGGYPDSVARQLIAQRDRATYLKAMCSLMINDSSLTSETSLLLHCNLRSSKEADCLLCLCQIRVAISSDGNELCVGTKFTPLPTSSEYITVKSLKASSPRESKETFNETPLVVQRIVSTDFTIQEPPSYMSTHNTVTPTAGSFNTYDNQIKSSNFPVMYERSPSTETSETSESNSQDYEGEFSWDDVHPPEFVDNFDGFGNLNEFDIQMDLGFVEWENSETSSVQNQNMVNEISDSSNMSDRSAYTPVQHFVEPPSYPPPPITYGVSDQQFYEMEGRKRQRLDEPQPILLKKSSSYDVDPFSMVDPNFDNFTRLNHFLSKCI